MRILITGTLNGNFNLLNRYIDETGVDFVLCTGNIGVYYYRDQLLPLKYRQINNFHKYILGKRKLHAPVYAVPGNRENFALVSKFLSGSLEIDNFHIIGQGEKVILSKGTEAVGVTGLGGSYSGKYYATNYQFSNPYSAMRYYTQEDYKKFVGNSGTNILLMHELIGQWTGKTIDFHNDMLALFLETRAVYCFAGHYRRWIHGSLPRSYRHIEFLSMPPTVKSYGILDTSSWSFQGVDQIVKGDKKSGTNK